MNHFIFALPFFILFFYIFYVLFQINAVLKIDYNNKCFLSSKLPY